MILSASSWRAIGWRRGTPRARLEARRARGAPEARLFLTSQRPAEWVASGADYVCASAVKASDSGLELEIESSRGAARLASSLIGNFNVENLLSVVAVLLAWGVTLGVCCGALG